MGEGLVSRVVSLLKGYALRAAPAGPGEPFVSPETPVAAVSILKLEPEKALGTVRVQLLVPEYMGAAACEEEATRVGLVRYDIKRPHAGNQTCVGSLFR